MSGINFSAQDKFAIAKKLDDIGIDYIEGGFPGSNPKDREFFELAAAHKWRNAKICAFGSTHHKKYTPESDPNLNALLQAKTPVIVLFGKSSLFHAEEILQVSAEQNLEIIEGSIRFLVEHGKQVIFDAEHFFDGYAEDKRYAMACLSSAVKGGAMNLTLADTNGGMLPRSITTATKAVRDAFETPVGIHAHNDSDLAVANSLAAVNGGATLVQGTVNGLGERCGNANLCSIIPNLQIKMGFHVMPAEKLKKLTELSRFVQELCNLNPRKDLPFVGRWAFRHKGGVHVAAMRKNPNSYQHIHPELVGNASSSSISELSGKANINDFLEQRGISATVEQVQEILQSVKAAENNGLSYEGGDASLELLINSILEKRQKPFEVKDYFVYSRMGANSINDCAAIEGTVKVVTKSGEYHTAGYGNGPVNALDAAIRKALEHDYPWLSGIELIDFKVRIIDSKNGTSAKTHVQIETRDEAGEVWRTVGCSANIISASMQALYDSLVYAIFRR